MITIQFGPWAPDQSDTPIQIPDQQGPITVPCADCLNVYYSNGSYKSIPSPKTALIDGNTTQALSTQALNAISYFDDVAQQETVFVGTSTGVQQLNPDGSWSQVSLLTSQSATLVGLSLGFKVGNLGNTDAIRGTAIAFKLGAVGTQITGQGFVAGRLVQHFPFGSSSTMTGYSNLLPTFGALTSANPFPFGSLQVLEDTVGLTGSAGSVFSVGSATDPTKTAFTTIIVNGVTMTSASASYTYSASQQIATWSWNAIFGLSSGSTYTVAAT